MLKKYSGQLGDFEYDDTQYTIVKDDDGEYCHYVGSEMKNVPSPPVGLRDYTGLYMGTDIENPVVIENGVKRTNSMYADCQKLKIGSYIPDSVEEEDFMYDGCINLESIPNFSKNSVSLKATCANCYNLRQLPPIPGKAIDCDSIALNCESLEGPVEIEEGVKRISYGFAGCHSLGEAVRLPKSIEESECVFENCRWDNDFGELNELDSSGFVEAYIDESQLSPRTLSKESKQAMAAAIAPDVSIDNYEATIGR